MSSASSSDLQYHPAVKALAHGLKHRCKVTPRDAIVVGCSGGADSVALLRGLLLLRDKRTWNLRIIVGHVNHHLRGKDSDDDADFVGALAATHDCAYERCDIHPPTDKGNLENICRKMRYQSLCEIAMHHGASLVATAHHADDQLETLLMRFLRGAGPKGLRGVAWRRRLRCDSTSLKIHAIRPLLATQREQLRDLLAQLNQDWREDQSNQDHSRTRARLRHEVIPILKQIKADASDRAVQMSDQFTDMHRLLDQQVNAADATREDNQHALNRKDARSMNAMVLTQILRRDLMALGVPPDRIPGHALRPIVTAVRDDAGGERTFDFAKDVRIHVTASDVRVLKV